MQIFIKTYTGKRPVLQVEADATVASVKEQIWEKEQIPPEQQVLYFAGKALRDECAVSDYEIQSECTLELEPSPRAISIHVQKISGEFMEISAYSTDTTADLKERIRKAPGGVAEEVQTLVFQNVVLEDPAVKPFERLCESQLVIKQQHQLETLQIKPTGGNLFEVAEANGSAASGSAPDDLEGRSKIMDVFQFKAWTVRSKITFDDLDVEPSLKFEPMVYLSLPISEVPSVPSYRPEVNLLDCLHQFATREELGEDDWAYCETTRRCERSSKQLDLWTAPECLIIHLKRFAVDFASGDTEKIDTFVRFPMDLDLAPFVMGPGGQDAQYRLYAVVNHSGSLSFGHYTAYCKVGEEEHDRRWYLFNDATVSAARESDVVSREAYMLFYERVPVHEPSCQPNS
eukprot:Skav236775  [mRNA]  locus=scaffold1361:32085:49540:+ [translate_table: standard]